MTEAAFFMLYLGMVNLSLVVCVMNTVSSAFDISLKAASPYFFSKLSSFPTVLLFLSNLKVCMSESDTFDIVS